MTGSLIPKHPCRGTAPAAQMGMFLAVGRQGDTCWTGESFGLVWLVPVQESPPRGLHPALKTSDVEQLLSH